MTALDSITTSISEHRLNAWYYQRFLEHNPVLGPLVLAYLQGGSRPSSSALGENHYALGLVHAEDARRELLGGSASLALPRAVKDFGVPTTGDAQPRFQSMLEQLRSGDAVAVESELFTFNNPVRVPHDAMRIVGLGGQNKLDGGYWSTTRIQAGRSGMAIFEEGFSTSVKHVGATYEWINLVSDKADCRGWDMRNVNSWKLLHCSAFGRYARGSIYLDIPIAQSPSGDNSYSYVDDFIAYQTEGPSVWVQEGMIRIDGGYFDAPGGIRLIRASNCALRDGKSNHSGRLFLIEGGWNWIENWGFEQFDSASNIPIIEVLRNTSLGVPWSGSENHIRGTINPHPYGAGRCLRFGPGTSGNDYLCDFVTNGTRVVDEGQANVNLKP